jgi:hypothetical protein
MVRVLPSFWRILVFQVQLREKRRIDFLVLYVFGPSNARLIILHPILIPGGVDFFSGRVLGVRSEEALCFTTKNS